MPNQLPFSPVKDDSVRSGLTLAFLNERFPGVDTLVEHSTNNVNNGTFLRRDNGKISTISSITVGIGDKQFLIPTIFDGKEVSAKEATKRARAAMKKGMIFPSADNHEELDELGALISANLRPDSKVQTRK